MECIPEHTVGATRTMPRALSMRLVRLHLLDTVRGQTPAYKRNEVERADLQFEAVDLEDSTLVLEIRGTTRAERTGSWPARNFAKTEAAQRQGIACSLRGRARWNTETRRFEEFELIAEAERWGATQFNGRGDDLDQSPIGFVLRMVADPPRVAPANWWQYGWTR